MNASSSQPKCRIDYAAMPNGFMPHGYGSRLSIVTPASTSLPAGLSFFGDDAEESQVVIAGMESLVERVELAIQVLNGEECVVIRLISTAVISARRRTISMKRASMSSPVTSWPIWASAGAMLPQPMPSSSTDALQRAKAPLRTVLSMTKIRQQYGSPTRPHAPKHSRPAPQGIHPLIVQILASGSANDGHPSGRSQQP